MKYFISGIVLSLVGVIISFFIWGLSKTYIISGCIGLALIGICAIFSGSMLSGDRMRANYATETYEDRQNRDKFVTRFFLLGFPNLIVAIVLFALFK